MARFVTGKTFGTTETVTAALLNQAVNDAAISTDSVDGSTIEVNSNALRLKDSGITTAKIDDSSSKTTGVTFAKMQHISTAKVLGRVSASEGDVEEVDVVVGGSGDAGLLFDNDDMLDNSDTAGGSATRGATQQSIKAYVDTTAIFTESFESAETSLPAAGTPVTFSHGLSSIPKIAQIVLRCKSAEFNYSVGDEIVIGDYGDAGQMQSLFFNTSTIGWGHMYSASTILIKDKTIDNAATASSPNFMVVLKAFA